MTQATAILGFPEYQIPAQQLAEALGLPYLGTEIHQFPDQESKVILPENLPDHLILCRSLHIPNSKLIELLFVANAARQQGVQQLTLVAPYLCYMRQDKAFQSGEIVSQKIIGEFLAQLFDCIITVDPHLHRISSLGQAIPGSQAISLTATQALGAFLTEQKKDYFLIGPDEESEQWVAAIAASGDYDYAIASKIRHSDRDVRVSLPDINVTKRDVVLVDDMVSTGYTMIEAAKQLVSRGTNSISCLVTHPLFTEDAVQAMQQNGITNIWSSNSILHPTNRVFLTPLLTDAIRDKLEK